MKPPARLRLRRACLGVAGAAVLATAALGWAAPGAVPAAYRFAVLACLGPALGSLFFVLIHRMTGGQWGLRLAPFLEAGVRLLPWIWIATLPLLLGPGLAEPAHPRYSGRIALAARSVGYAAVFFLLSRATLRARRSARPEAWAWLGPAGLIVLVFMVHLLAVDWIFPLQPHWTATGFPLVWMIGQAAAGLALALASALLFGADPAAEGPEGRSFGLDWGNLLLASIAMWTYVAFVQFLLIWAGNLPREISWYVRRSAGAWPAVAGGLALFHFALPFIFLLSRRFKRFPAGLLGAAAAVLGGQLLYTAWLVLPGFGDGSPLALALDAAVLAAAAGIAFAAYLELAGPGEETP